LGRAVALDPGYATAHLYWGIHLTNRGQLDRALSELLAARAIDPLSAPVRMQLGRAYLVAGRLDQAVASLRSAIELNPQFDAAFRWLARGFAERAGTMRTIKVSAAFNPLHSDARWAPLLRRMGLEP